VPHAARRTSHVTRHTREEVPHAAWPLIIISILICNWPWAVLRGLPAVHVPPCRGFGFVKGRSRKKKKKRGYLPTYLFLRFYGVFGLIMQRNSQKRDKKKIRWEKTKGKIEKGFFSQLIRPKVFGIGFPQKVLCGVFELPLLRNAQKRHKKNLKN
jgi:hypothetical protein